MSRYLDVNGDGTVDDGRRARSPTTWPGTGPTRSRSSTPTDHLYASGTGDPLDCPQPDLGTLPGERTDWTPEPVDTTTPYLGVTSPEHGAETTDGTVDVTGTVERRPVEPEPTEPTGSHDDADDDAGTPLTELLSVDARVTDTHVESTLSVEKLWPSTEVTSPAAYSVIIDGRRFDSFVPDPRRPAEVVTWDSAMENYLPEGSSTWDLAANTVTFQIPRQYLAGARITTPYYVTGQTAVEPATRLVAVDDKAPDTGKGIGVAGAPLPEPEPEPAPAPTDPGTPAEPRTVTFEHEGGNTFTAADSSLGERSLVDDTSHHFDLAVDQPSDVELQLTWDDPGGTDLDLFATGASDSGSRGASAGHPESVVLEDVQGDLALEVDPYLVGGSTTYELTATLRPVSVDGDGDGVNDGDDRCPAEPGPAPTGCPDRDGDGVADRYDTCPDQPGDGADGCPRPVTEHVRVYVDGTLAGEQGVDTRDGSDTYDVPVEVAPGTHEVRIDWVDDGEVIATATRTVVRGTAGTDRDGDSVADGTDNCVKHPNADQADLDGDGKGDACDSDLDGDGHSNAKERAHGTDPADPADYPRKRQG